MCESECKDFCCREEDQEGCIAYTPAAASAGYDSLQYPTRQDMRNEIAKLKEQNKAMIAAIGQARALEVGDVYEVFGQDWEAIEKAAGF